VKKYLPHIILSVIAVAAVLFLLTGNSDSDRKKQFDNRVTLNKRDKNPYGAYIAYQGLKHLFPRTTIYSGTAEPGYWDSLSSYDNRQALIVISPRFYPDEFEMKKLLAFVENGNDVFISTRFISSQAENFLGSKTSPISVSNLTDGTDRPVKDSLSVSLVNPPYKEQRKFSYNGMKYNAWFYELDSTIAEKKGFGELERINFVQLKAGKGNFYLHLSPLCFSNYFLLHSDNLAYYENVLSVIPPDTRKIMWDEYYINKMDYYYRNSGDDEENAGEGENSIAELFKYKETKWALLLAIFLLILYVLLEMRRRQRYIPVISKHRNDSLDFVKTIGRLYYERADHHNLCRKMASYFLEHVRSRYKLPTNQLNEEFISKLKFKSGVEEAEIRSIVSFIQKLDTTGSVTAKQAADFHKQLENFYQKA
jgi:hypothetical protein